MKIGTLALRVSIGGFFVGHGAQKLFGAGGGPGLKGTAAHFEGLGIRPGFPQAVLAGAAETGGGLGLLLGYRTPLAASAIVAAMTTAITRVHGKNGWNIQQGGYEYCAVIIAGAVAVAEQGPGFLSLDALRGNQRQGLLPGAFALGVGIAGAIGGQIVGDQLAGAPSPQPVVAEPTAPAAPAVASTPQEPVSASTVEAKVSGALDELPSVDEVVDKLPSVDEVVDVVKDKARAADPEA